MTGVTPFSPAEGQGVTVTPIGLGATAAAREPGVPAPLWPQSVAAAAKGGYPISNAFKRMPLKVKLLVVQLDQGSIGEAGAAFCMFSLRLNMFSRNPS